MLLWLLSENHKIKCNQRVLYQIYTHWFPHLRNPNLSPCDTADKALMWLFDFLFPAYPDWQAGTLLPNWSLIMAWQRRDSVWPHSRKNSVPLRPHKSLAILWQAERGCDFDHNGGLWNNIVVSLSLELLIELPHYRWSEWNKHNPQFTETYGRASYSSIFTHWFCVGFRKINQIINSTETLKTQRLHMITLHK